MLTFYFNVKFDFMNEIITIDICFTLLQYLVNFKKKNLAKLESEFKDTELHTILSNIIIVNNGEDGGEEDGTPFVWAQKCSEYSMSSFLSSRLTRMGVLKHKTVLE